MEDTPAKNEPRFTTSHPACTVSSTTSTATEFGETADWLACYTRYSTEMQKETSIDDQVSKCRKAVERLGYTIPDHLIFADEAMSGTSASNRPGLQKLIQLAKQENCPFRGIVRVRPVKAGSQS
jgi:hypothetical protein